MSKHKIKWATACYTGGGIYIYWGQLENGDHFRAIDDWDMIFICDEDTSLDNEAANWPEFYDEHTIEEIHGDDFVTFWNAMLRHIIDKNERGNYSNNELLCRFIEPIAPPTLDELADRISDALEVELGRIYEELRVESGDISPLDALEWDEVTAKAAYLFQKLIEQNNK
jgi:hypothetical protein